jgi:hypothetical protein
MKASALGVVAISLVSLIATTANAIYCSSTYTNCVGTVKTVHDDCPDCTHPPKADQGCGSVDTLGDNCIMKRTIVCGNGCTPE